MRIPLFYIEMIILLVFFLSACKTEEVVKEPEESYTLEEIMGDWKMIRKDYNTRKQSLERFREAEANGLNSEHQRLIWEDSSHIIHPYMEDEYLSCENKYIRIEKDNIFWLNYPFEMEGKSGYSFDSNYVQLKGERDKRKIRMSADRNILHISYLDLFGLYLTESYNKVAFEDSVVTLLKEKELNYPLLAGSWELIREDSYAGEPYELDFPYPIPDTLILTHDQLVQAMRANGSIVLPGDPAQRKYTIEYHKDYFGFYYLWLIPGPWYKDHDPGIHFNLLDAVFTKQSDKP